MTNKSNAPATTIEAEAGGTISLLIAFLATLTVAQLRALWEFVREEIAPLLLFAEEDYDRRCDAQALTAWEQYLSGLSADTAARYRLEWAADQGQSETVERPTDRLNNFLDWPFVNDHVYTVVDRNKHSPNVVAAALAAGASISSRFQPEVWKEITLDGVSVRTLETLSSCLEEGYVKSRDAAREAVLSSQVVQETMKVAQSSTQAELSFVFMAGSTQFAQASVHELSTLARLGYLPDSAEGQPGTLVELLNYTVPSLAVFVVNGSVVGLRGDLPKSFSLKPKKLSLEQFTRELKRTLTQ